MAVWTGGTGTTDWFYIKHTHFGYPDDVVTSNWDVSPNTPANNADILITSNYTVTNGSGTYGSLTLGTGASLTTAATGGLFSVSGVVNSGTIAVTSSSAGYFVIRGAAATLTGGGTITLQSNDPQHYGTEFGHDDGANLVLTNADNTINGGGTIDGYRSGSLTLINSGTINATGNGTNLYGALFISASGGVTNHALIEATGTAGLAISSNVDNRDGRILVLDGSHASLSGTIIGGRVSAIASGYIDATGATFDGSNGGIALSGAVNAAQTTLRGAVSSAGVIDVGTNHYLYVDGANATLSGGGTVLLRANAPQHYYSILSNGTNTDTTLTNADNTISGGGIIGSEGSHTLTLVNHGTISATGDSSNNYGALSISTSGGLTNDGTLQAAVAGSTLAIATGRTVVNNGVMSAANGGSLTVSDAVSGTGSLRLSGGGSATFASTFDQNVAFSGATTTETLVLSANYAGTISGLGIGDAIDLGNLGYSTALHVAYSGTSAGGTLSLLDGSNAVVASLHIAGDYAANDFTLGSYGNNHVSVTTTSLDVDRTPPAIALQGESVSFSGGRDQVQVYGSVENVPGTVVHVLDGTTDLGTAILDGAGHWSFSTTFATGSHALHALATDAAGNTAETGPAAAVSADTATFAFRFTNAAITEQPGSVVVRGPDGTSTVLAGFNHYAFTDGTVNEHAGSALVDDLFYFGHNLDVWNAHVDATAHYDANGWHEGRDPSAYFSTSGYLAANADVRAAGVNPLTHYDTNGWHEGRDPSAAFDNELYLARNPDVAQAGIDPLAHYLTNGQAEGRQAYAAIGRGGDIAAAHGFDAEYYLLNNPDVARAAINAGGDSFAFAYQHYETYGWHEGRNPNAVFDVTGYLNAYADVRAANVDPLAHYDSNGWREGRDPSATFDTRAYESHYADVAQAGIDPLTHYLTNGIYEGRSAYGDGHFA